MRCRGRDQIQVPAAAVPGLGRAEELPQDGDQEKEEAGEQQGAGQGENQGADTAD